MEKTYLGDGVYAEHDGFQVWIWTSNGVRESERIALEPVTLKALNEFVKFCTEKHGGTTR